MNITAIPDPRPQQHIDKLQGLLDRSDLNADARLFLKKEIWDIQIDMQKTALADGPVRKNYLRLV